MFSHDTDVSSLKENTAGIKITSNKALFGSNDLKFSHQILDHHVAIVAHSATALPHEQGAWPLCWVAVTACFAAMTHVKRNKYSDVYGYHHIFIKRKKQKVVSYYSFCIKGLLSRVSILIGQIKWYGSLLPFWWCCLLFSVLAQIKLATHLHPLFFCGSCSLVVLEFTT